jgi:hypothetical protein
VKQFRWRWLNEFTRRLLSSAIIGTLRPAWGCKVEQRSDRVTRRAGGARRGPAQACRRSKAGQTVAVALAGEPSWQRLHPGRQLCPPMVLHPFWVLFYVSTDDGPTQGLCVCVDWCSVPEACALACFRDSLVAAVSVCQSRTPLSVTGKKRCFVVACLPPHRSAVHGHRRQTVQAK